MKPNTDQPEASESKLESKPDAKDDLKALSMTELQAKLGSHRTASVKLRRRSSSSNMGRMNLRKRRQITF
jgi:hypothetical protein